jgi:hypothetical protein
MNETNNVPAQPASSKFLQLIAKIISIVFHPIFMPIVMTLVIYDLAPGAFKGISNHTFGLWLINITVNTVFFPMFAIGLLKPLGFISSYQMPTSKERIVPLIITLIFYFWINHVMANIPNIKVPLPVRVLFLGNICGIIIIFLINVYTKISMHTAAMGAMLGTIIILLLVSPINMQVPLVIAIIIAGIVGSARMILGAHQRGDVWLGYIVGIAVQLGAYMYLK